MKTLLFFFLILTLFHLSFSQNKKFLAKPEEPVQSTEEEQAKFLACQRLQNYESSLEEMDFEELAKLIQQCDAPLSY